jgi:hypothetical protein
MHTKVNSCAKVVKLIKSQQPHFVTLTVLQSNLACGELTLCVTTRERGNENQPFSLFTAPGLTAEIITGCAAQHLNKILVGINTALNLSRVIAVTFFAAINGAYGFTETVITSNRSVS